MNKVLIRADSSESIGTGHIMRCLTLAKEIRSSTNVWVEFICQNLPGNIGSLIEEEGFYVNYITSQKLFDIEVDAEQTWDILKSNSASLLIVDNYQITDHWIRLIRKNNNKIFVFVIDDLADRYLSADALLNQNFLPNIESKYESLVPKGCRLFLGPKYALLRQEFYRTRNANNVKPERLTIVVFFGGTDPTGETLKSLPALVSLAKDHSIDVITGASNKNNRQIEKIVSSVSYINHHCQVSNISHYMAKATFSIGAGGSTCLERMFFALPNVTVITADNQLVATEFYQSKGLVKNLGWHESVSSDDIYEASLEFISNQNLLLDYQNNMKKIGVGTLGATYISSSLFQLTS